MSPADFVSIEMDQLYADATGPRNPDGSLPDIGLHLDPSSHLIDAGIDVGLPYNGEAPDLGAFETEGTPSSISEPDHTTEAAPFRVGVAPNPFVTDTSFRFELDAPGEVSVKVFDVRGHLVRGPQARALTAGSHAIGRDGRDDAGQRLASGVYWVRVASGERLALEKILMLR